MTPTPGAGLYDRPAAIQVVEPLTADFALDEALVTELTGWRSFRCDKILSWPLGTVRMKVPSVTECFTPVLSFDRRHRTVHYALDDVWDGGRIIVNRVIEKPIRVFFGTENGYY